MNLESQDEERYVEKPVSLPPDALEAALAARDTIDRAYKKGRIKGRVILGVFVVGYILALRVIYHVFPPLNLLVYLVITVGTIWASDYRGVSDADDPGSPIPMRLGMGYVPVRLSLSTANMFSWIMFCIFLVGCFSEVATRGYY